MQQELIKKVTEVIIQDSKELLIKGQNNFEKELKKSLVSKADKVIVFSDVIQILSALKTETAYQAIIPKEILEGLKNGLYEFNKSDGELLAQILNKSGGIKTNLRLEEISKIMHPSTLANLASNVAMQMKLAKIENLIMDVSIQINNKLDLLIQMESNSIRSDVETAVQNFQDYKTGKIADVTSVRLSLNKAIADLHPQIPTLIKNLENSEQYKLSETKSIFLSFKKSVDFTNLSKIANEAYEFCSYLQLLYLIRQNLDQEKDADDISSIMEFSSYLEETFKDANTSLRPLITWSEGDIKKFWKNEFPDYKTSLLEMKKELIEYKELQNV